MNVRRLVTCLTFLTAVSVHAQERLNLWPQPQQVTRFEARFRLNDETAVYLDQTTEAGDVKLRHAFVEAIQKRTGWALPAVQQPRASNVVYLGGFGAHLPEAIRQNLNLTDITRLGAEGYYLLVTDSLAAVLANTPTGRFYGVQTLLQWLRSTEGGVELPGLVAYDWPALAVRGLTLDFEEGPFPNTQYFKQVLRRLGRARLNTLVLDVTTRLEPTERSPRASHRAWLTRGEAAELQAVARENHVLLVPALKTLSGLRRVLTQPRYAELAEFPGARTLVPLQPETYAFLEQRLFQITETFDAPYVLLTGTEPTELGWQRSAEVVARLGRLEVLAEHYRRVIELVRKYQRRVWLDAQLAEEHPELVSWLPDDVTWVAAQPRRPFRPSQLVFAVELGSDRPAFPALAEGFPASQEAARRAVQSGAKGVLLRSENPLPQPAFLEFQMHAWDALGAVSWAPFKTSPGAFLEAYFPSLEQEWLHTLAGDLGEWLRWPDLAAHPLFVSAKSPSQRFHLKSKARQLERLLTRLSRDTTRTVPGLDYFRFLSSAASYLAEKIELSAAVRELRSPAASDGRSQELLERCLNLAEDLNEIEETLQLLWVRHYRIEEVAQGLQAFSQQLDYWQEIAEQIQNGQIVQEPDLGSAWLYHPTDPEGAEVSHAYFRKTFEVAPGFRQAFLQTMADSHVKVYLNGGFVDEVVAPPDFSPREPAGRAKLWDITQALRPGKNVLAVEAWHYRPGAAAGFNLYGRIDYDFGRRIEVTSDAYWKTSTKAEADWQKLGFFDVQWLNAEVRPAPVRFTKPNFKSGRPSHPQWVQP